MLFKFGDDCWVRTEVSRPRAPVFLFVDLQKDQPNPSNFRNASRFSELSSRPAPVLTETSVNQTRELYPVWKGITRLLIATTLPQLS